MVIVDGVDEAAGHVETVEKFLLHELTKMRVAVAATSRPEGIQDLGPYEAGHSFSLLRNKFSLSLVRLAQFLFEGKGI